MNAKIEKSSENPPGTILESDDEIKKAQQQLRDQALRAESQPAKLFRPTTRPPVVQLTICDDGSATGEIIRIRDEQFIVGRTEGNLKLPFDDLLSSRHLAITRQTVKGSWRWVVTDLQSKNGVFFRVSKAPLSHNTEFLIGNGCYRYQLNQNAGPETAIWNGNEADAPATRELLANQSPGGSLLSEVVRGGSGQRISLAKETYTIGSHKSCDIVRFDDPFTESKHATLARSDKGTWVIQNNKAKNGVWIRLPQIGIDKDGKCEFQAGEQRFKLNFGASH